MTPPIFQPDFSSLLSIFDAKNLLSRLETLQTRKNDLADTSIRIKTDAQLKKLSAQWQCLIEQNSIRCSKKLVKDVNEDEDHQQNLAEETEQAMTNWLIELFNHLFTHHQVILVRGTGEPEYFPANKNQPARIEFAHGFFQSALHEISHFCIAGQQRRLLPDFGYWYAPDGRSAAQQQAFERVEIKPQAIECLFSLACGRTFEVSQDNLFAEFDTSCSTFAEDVYRQVKSYIANPETLPPDAKTLLHALLSVCNTY